MYSKYMVLFCLTYYCVPTVISFAETEYARLFDQIRNPEEDYVTHDTLGRVYDVLEKDELDYVMAIYGNDVVDGENGFRERRVYFNQFKEAALAGYIHRYNREEMLNLFFKINGNRLDRIYIVRSDMVRHYRRRVLTAQIDDVMTTYGTWHPGGTRLNFLGLRRAVNTGSIPAW